MPKVNKPLRIPKFRSEAEEAAFWDTHDSTDYLADLKRVQVTFAPPRPKVLVSVRIAKPEVTALRQIAARKGLAYASLIRLWLKEKLMEELSAEKR